MSVYYKYAPYGGKFFLYLMLMIVSIRYTSKALRKLFVDSLGNIFHMIFLRYAY